jgi:hypothetical protein
MVIPEFPELKPVSLEDREEVRRYLELYPPEICELTFANIFIWRHWEKPSLTRIHNNLCIFCAPPDEPPYFLEPVGNNDLDETIKAGLSLAPRFSRLSEKFLSKLKAKYVIQEDRDNFDYVYSAEDLATLRGKKYDGKRNWIKRFEKKYRCEIIELTPTDFPGCLELVERWGNNSTDQERTVDEKSRAAVLAINEALNNFQELELRSMVLLCDGMVEAFCLWEKLNAETAVAHVELASREIDGLHQFLNRECAATLGKQFTFINREQDAGHPGLRRSKLSYHPHHFVKKCNLFSK